MSPTGRARCPRRDRRSGPATGPSAGEGGGLLEEADRGDDVADRGPRARCVGQRGILAGPDPDGTDPGRVRARDVLLRAVADEDRVRGHDAEPTERNLERVGVGLAVLAAEL